MNADHTVDRTHAPPGTLMSRGPRRTRAKLRTPAARHGLRAGTCDTPLAPYRDTMPRNRGTTSSATRASASGAAVSSAPTSMAESCVLLAHVFWHTRTRTRTCCAGHRSTASRRLAAVARLPTPTPRRRSLPPCARIRRPGLEPLLLPARPRVLLLLLRIRVRPCARGRAARRVPDTAVHPLSSSSPQPTAPRPRPAGALV